MTQEEIIDSKNMLKYIEARNYLLETEELLYITDLKLHPQLDHISFNVFSSEYRMWDKRGTFFKFYALNINEKRSDFPDKKRVLRK